MPHPDRRTHDQHVGGENLRENVRPLVAVALVGRDAGLHVVVGDTDVLAIGIPRCKRVDDLPPQLLGG